MGRWTVGYCLDGGDGSFGGGGAGEFCLAFSLLSVELSLGLFAFEFLEEEFPASDERDEIIGFIRESGRGIIKRYSKSSFDEDYAD